MININDINVIGAMHEISGEVSVISNTSVYEFLHDAFLCHKELQGIPGGIYYSGFVVITDESIYQADGKIIATFSYKAINNSKG